LLVFINYSFALRLIAEEVVTPSQLQSNVKEFNTWHRKKNPQTKVEVKIKPDGNLGVFALEDIKVINSNYNLILGRRSYLRN
jgi:hypothetical protein